MTGILIRKKKKPTEMQGNTQRKESHVKVEAKIVNIPVMKQGKPKIAGKNQKIARGKESCRGIGESMALLIP